MSVFAANIRRYGEAFTRMDGTQLKASVKESTGQTLDLAARAYFFDGLAEAGAVAGEYLTRAINGRTYLVETVHEQPRDASIARVYLAECNAVVSLAREVAVNAGSNPAKAWRIFAERVPVFLTTTTRQLAISNAGLLDTNITEVHIPALTWTLDGTEYALEPLDRVYIHSGDIELDKLQKFRLDAIDKSLADPIDGSGIYELQLSNDLRTGDIETAEPPPVEPPPGGGGLWD